MGDGADEETCEGESLDEHDAEEGPDGRVDDCALFKGFPISATTLSITINRTGTLSIVAEWCYSECPV